MSTQQINLSDEILFDRLLERMYGDSFAIPLIKAQIAAHRGGDEEATQWIRRTMGWDK